MFYLNGGGMNPISDLCINVNPFHILTSSDSMYMEVSTVAQLVRPTTFIYVSCILSSGYNCQEPLSSVVAAFCFCPAIILPSTMACLRTSILCLGT